MTFNIGRRKMTDIEYKRQGRKVISVSFNCANGIFSHVRIYGDFFIFPEEALDNLERSAEGKDFLGISTLIEDFFSSGNRVYGITKEDLQEVFKRAINEK